MTMTAPLHPETDGLCDPVSLGNRADPTERWYVGERCPAGCRVIVVEGLEVRPLVARTHDSALELQLGALRKLSARASLVGYL